MSDFYDKDGSRLDLMGWAQKYADMDYSRIAETLLPGGARVSTVWLGLDHQFGDGPPLIFETMVFAPGNSDDLDTWRYGTLIEAEEGHETMVRKWNDGVPA